MLLWFDACLFDQSFLLHHLHWLKGHGLGEGKLMLICIDRFSGVEPFHGLGQLSPDQLTSLFDSRLELTSRHLAWGSRGWEAYCAPQPTAITDYLSENDHPLPFVAPALRRHLERFPWTSNGLNRLQNSILGVLTQAGEINFGAFFKKLRQTEKPAFFGDSYVAQELRRLATGHSPALSVRHMDKGFKDWRIASNAHSKAFLSGEMDWVKKNGIDRWLGGVHLKKEAVWRWEPEKGRVKREEKTA
jgi:hypothetical protein